MGFKLSPRMRGCTKNVIIPLFITFVILEVALRLTDPWHMRSLADWPRFDWVEISKGYSLAAPGDYTLTTWKAHVNDDYTRAVPDTKPAACRVVAIGDSVTFGYGVQDSETWVNLLARAFPDVEFVNAGNPGADSHDILLRQQEVEGDVYLYLLTRNDVVDGPSDFDPVIIPPSLFETYVTAYAKWAIALQIGRTIKGDWPRFWSDLDAITANGRTYLISYDMPEVRERYPDLIWVDWHRQPLSVMDHHPTPASHQDLATLLTPYVRNIIEDRCPNADTPQE